MEKGRSRKGVQGERRGGKELAREREISRERENWSAGEKEREERREARRNTI